jgi:lysophospholipase L1-like esterase
MPLWYTTIDGKTKRCHSIPGKGGCSMRSFKGQLLWWSTGAASLLSLVIFAVGFWFALNPQLLAPAKSIAPNADQQPHAAAPLPVEGKLRVVTLGDSLTRGTGDANGQGYVGLLRQALEKETGEQPIVSNLAINGLQSPGLLEQLEQPQVQKLVGEASLLFFTIGGNDLFQQSGGVYTIDEKKLASAEKTLAANFELILKQLRKLNQTATIVYISLYNPFGDTEAAVDTTVPLLAWNSRAAEIAARHQGVIVVPTYDLFWQKERAYLYTDHFHPNSAGYARIAARILQALK